MNDEETPTQKINKKAVIFDMDTGTIVRFDLDRKLIKNDWVTCLTSNKGAGLHNGLLYTAETTGVAIIEVDKASIVKRIPVECSIMLNDLVIYTKGIIYVTDTRC